MSDSNWTPPYWFGLPRPSDEQLLQEAKEGSTGLQCPVPLMHPMRESAAYAADLFFRGNPSARGGFNAGVAWAIERFWHYHLTEDQKARFKAERADPT